MRALVVSSTAEKPEFRDIEAPRPGAGQIAISVAACGLNFADLLMLKGEYQDTPPLPFIPGLEVAGVVSALGDGVEGFKVGTRVAAFVGSGGLADTVVADRSRVVTLPETMEDTTAAGFLIAYGTSHIALIRRARLQAGETVLVLGAAGGVGRTAVEIAAASGARVIAVARGASRLKAAQDAGAHETIDSESEELLTAFRAAGPINILYDAIGGPIAEIAARALAPEGRHLLIGFASGELPHLKPNHMLVKNSEAIGVYWGGYISFAPEILRDSLADLMEMHTQGRLSPHVSHCLPFEQALDGFDLLRKRKATGKIVIRL